MGWLNSTWHVQTVRLKFLQFSANNELVAWTACCLGMAFLFLQSEGCDWLRFSLRLITELFAMKSQWELPCWFGQSLVYAIMGRQYFMVILCFWIFEWNKSGNVLESNCKLKACLVWVWMHKSFGGFWWIWGTFMGIQLGWNCSEMCVKIFSVQILKLVLVLPDIVRCHQI